MKVKIKDLKPNPFRDMKNYPINPEKIESLTNSIKQTGFWDNILARRNNGKFEIAYGHHRLVALKKLKKPSSYVDIPVKELDDPTMIRIMAHENMDSWQTNTQVLDETISVAKGYLLSHPEIVESIYRILKIKEYHTKHGISGRIISEFLGSKLWYTERVGVSLRRLKLEDEGILNKEAVEILPREYAASGFTTQVEKIRGVTSEQQKRAAKKIIKEKNFSDWGIKSALLDEKYRDVGTEKSEREIERIRAKDFVHGIAKDLEKINEKIGELIRLKNEPNFNFDVYENCIEAEEFTCEVKILIKNLKILGEKK